MESSEFVDSQSFNDKVRVKDGLAPNWDIFDILHKSIGVVRYLYFKTFIGRIRQQGKQTISLLYIIM